MKTVSFWRPRPLPERRFFFPKDMDKPSPDKRASLALRRTAAALLTWVRRVFRSVFQVFFRDQLGDISRQTERLGSASVESVTYLGSEVRSLDQRLAAIEEELAALRALLERRERAAEEDSEEVAVRPPAG
jgi:hypothetical protein